MVEGFLHASVALHIHTCSAPSNKCAGASYARWSSGAKRSRLCKAFTRDDTRQNLSERKLVNEEKSCMAPIKSVSTSWLKPAYCLPPLTKEEERTFSQDVQDLIYIQNKRDELLKKLGQSPSDQELADFIGCSIYRFYARIGKGRAARRKMIAANLPLVASVAKQFYGKGLSQQELCQEGVMGLFKSTEKFSIMHNVKFSTYSFYWIFERMSAAVNRFRNIVPVGKSLRRTLSSVLQCKDEFRKLHGRNPTVNELADASNVDEIKIRRVFSAIRPTKSFDNFFDNYLKMTHNPSTHQFADPESESLPWLSLWKSELKAELSSTLAILTPRELQVLYLKYGLDGKDAHTLYQVAATLGVSHESVRVAEKNAIRKLKEFSIDRGLQHYFDNLL